MQKKALLASSVTGIIQTLIIEYGTAKGFTLFNLSAVTFICIFMYALNYEEKRTP